MKKTFIHDPAIYRDETSGRYYLYTTRANGYVSDDLVHWEGLGQVATVLPEAEEWTGGHDIWAPDIVKVGDEYRLYCSNSTWGVQQSCIFLAVSDKAAGPFTPKAPVIKTSDKLPVNGIDANIITDVKTGEMYMLYGSFWGGSHMLKLDRETGLAAEEGVGTCVCRRPAWLSTAVEGPYMIYNKETGYYYLFVSYGSLKTDYNIRVGRSKDIFGPFLDMNGKCLTEEPDAKFDPGYMIMAGYTWNEGKAYMAPGHNSVLMDKDGKSYIVYHIREKRFNRDAGPSEMQIRQIFWNEEGWPVASAFTMEETGGALERKVGDALTMKAVAGVYQRINFTIQFPQGISTAVPMLLREDGYYESCCIQGTWRIEGSRIIIKYGPFEETALFYEGRGFAGVSGISKDGTEFIARRDRVAWRV
ncbi:MAG: arabinan endo-1,5-alpha-L-arabinosidase [Lachnospiraceae bacterium]|nr:arabinan endo-1,5-alpha-L-arabinosidase [Lachnospiraceae bacterium]